MLSVTWNNLFKPLLILSFLSLAFGCKQGGGGGGGSAPTSIVSTIDYTLKNGVVPATAHFRLINSPSETLTWDFDDGSSLIDGPTEISHQYSQSGSYQVKAYSGQLLVSTHSFTLKNRSLSGQIYTDRIAYIRDLDTHNDTDISGSSAAENDSLHQAQRLNTHQRVLGNIGQSSSDQPNNQQDTEDWFQVDVTDTNTHLHLNTTDSASTLRLTIFDDSSSSATPLYNQTLSTNSITENIYTLAGSAKTLWIAVTLEAGNQKSYLLSIDTSAQSPSFRHQDPFIIGQAIVQFKESASSSGRARSTLTQDLTTNIRPIGLVDLDSVSNSSLSSARSGSFGAFLPRVHHARAFRSPSQDPYPRSDLVDQATRNATLAKIQLLNEHPDIVSASPNYVRTLIKPKTQISSGYNPQDSYFSLQWHYPQIQLEEAWSIIGAPLINAGDTIEIAIIDTGHLPQHPDASSATPGCNGGFDFISNPYQSIDGDGWDSDPTDPGDLYLSYHGTHVAGTIGANTSNNLGVAGIAWGTSLCHLRVLGLTGGTEYDLIQAILYAAALPGDYEAYIARRTEPVDIINLSLGGTSYSFAENQAVQDAVNQGVILVAAMGNEGSNVPQYPAAYANVIGVGATGSTNTITSYSNEGSHIDVSAPGGDFTLDAAQDGYPDGVLSLSANDYDANIQYEYAFYEGTSMATPHVSGVIALMKQQFPTLDTQHFLAMLQQDLLTDDIMSPGFDQQSGYGQINALKAVISAQNQGQTTQSQQLLISNPNLVFTDTSSQTLSMTNLSNSQTTITQITWSESWVTIVPTLTLPVTLDPNQSLSLTVTVTEFLQKVGDLSALIAVDFNDASSRSFSVTTSLPPLPLTNIGSLYVVILDSHGDWPSYLTNQWDYAITQVEPDQQGEYHFELNSVGSGNAQEHFSLFASTDLDGDGKLCDFGEFCASLDFLENLSSNNSTLTINDNASWISQPLYGSSRFTDDEVLSIQIPESFNQ